MNSPQAAAPGRPGVPDAPRLTGLATAVPPHLLRQADARKAMERVFAGAPDVDSRLLDVFEHARIDTRHTCQPIAWYEADHSFEERNTLYVEHAVRLACEASLAALGRAGLQPDEVDHVVFVSSTGISTPSVDALVGNAIGFRSDVRRTPIWGLGCAGGAAGLAHARDFALADPGARVLVVALELCSLSFQLGDRSKKSLVAASLFGDGAAAVVVVGAAARGTAPGGRRPLALLASQSTLWKDTVDVMGWTVDGAGLHVVFSRDIPTIVREKVQPSLVGFLERHGLALSDIGHVVAHPGGVKVLNAYSSALGLPPAAFRHAADVLREHGNMSSPSCLFVLERFIESGEIAPGERAVVAALGPGFAAEYVLVAGLPA